MSTPFTQVTENTRIDDPVVWRELLLAIAERALEFDIFFLNTDNKANMQGVVDALYAQMHSDAYELNVVGSLQFGTFYNTAFWQTVGFFARALGSNVPWQNGSVTIWDAVGQSPDAQYPFSQQILDPLGFASTYTGIQSFRRIRTESDFALISSPSCPRGILRKGDILGWWTLVDLQLAMSAINNFQVDSFGTIGAASTTKSGRGVAIGNDSGGFGLGGIPGATSAGATKTIRIWDYNGISPPFPVQYTLQSTIGPTTAPIESFADTTYDFGGSVGVVPVFTAAAVTVEYDFANFGVTP